VTYLSLFVILLFLYLLLLLHAAQTEKLVTGDGHILIFDFF